MKVNEGTLDRTIRAIAGAVLLALGLIQAVSGIWLWIVVIVGALLLITGLVGFCPLYTLLKINTLKK